MVAMGNWDASGEPRESGPSQRSYWARIKAYLPRGNILSREDFAERHKLLCWMLLAHIPALFVFGVWRGYDPAHVALELQVPTLFLVLGWLLLRPGRLAAFFTTAGLIYCSVVLVHLSGGMIESHFHFFILLGFIALYQDWVPFFWNVLFVVVSHGTGSTLAPESMYDHYAAFNKPWLWAGIHGSAVLAAGVGMIILWHYTEEAQRRVLNLHDRLASARLSNAELVREQSVSRLLIHLARRNQMLLERQLNLITELDRKSVV